MTTRRPGLDRSGLDDVAAELIAGQRSGVVLQDRDGRILDFNEAALGWLAMTEDQLLGRSSVDERWEAIDADGNPLAGEQHPAMVALATGRPQLGCTLGIRSGRGELRWLLVDSVLLDHPEHGRVVVSQFADQTAERRALTRTTEALARLQQHVLPTAEPDVSWLDAEYRYENVAPPLDVGGDFLDVVQLDEGDVAFFIGDVAGHDLDAVATMVIARHTLRAAGLHLRSPQRVLRWLHDTLSATPDTVFCTVIFGFASLDADGSVAIRMANGGHPTPIVVRPDSTELVHGNGRLIGAPTAWVEPPLVEVRLERGESLVLFTDGLTENQQPKIEIEDLAEVLRSRPAADRRAMGVIDALLAAGRGSNRDDTAALVLTAR